MQNAKLFNKKNKKGQSVLPYTVALVLFNVFFYILVGAFAADPLADDVGYSGFGEITLNQSETSDSELTIGESSSFMSRFFIISYLDLPWWVQAFVILVNLVLLPLVVLAWIRGV